MRGHLNGRDDDRQWRQWRGKTRGIVWREESGGGDVGSTVEQIRFLRRILHKYEKTTERLSLARKKRERGDSSVHTLGCSPMREKKSTQERED